MQNSARLSLPEYITAISLNMRRCVGIHLRDMSCKVQSFPTLNLNVASLAWNEGFAADSVRCCGEGGLR